MDARNQGDCMIETKFTSKKQYTLKLQELEKLELLAIQKGEMPVFQVGFDKGYGKLKEYVVLNKHDYFALKENSTAKPCICRAALDGGDHEAECPSAYVRRG